MTHDVDELGYIEAELTLRRTEDGGRRTLIRTGYRPNWWLPGEAGHDWAGGTVEVVEAEELAPGMSGQVRIYPFVPDIWERMPVGSPLEMYEGPVLIGKATVRRVVPASTLVGSR